MCEVEVALANQPDTALHDSTEKTCLLIDIDMATADDSNVNTKETENLSKYKDLKIGRLRLSGYGKWGQKLCQL